jgi:hypothetical protein
MPPVNALAALALLVLLPGLLVARAPWTAVPALSLAFWAVCAWWPPFAWASRGRALTALLLASGCLALLRLLPRHEVPPPPGFEPPPAPPRPARPGLPPPALASPSSLLVLLAALALLLPALRSWHAPGPSLAFATTEARLVVWRDGPPLSAEPLLPLQPFGAYAPAVATLAADLSLLSGADPARCVLLLLLVAAGLALVGLFALHAAWAAPRSAAFGALLALAVAPWPLWLEPWGAGEALVALAFALPALALLAGHASRSSAVAASLLLAAGLLAQPLLTLLLLAGCSVVRGSRGGRGARLVRPAAALALGLVLAAPGLWPLARALSPRELAAVLTSPRAGALVALCCALPLLALAPSLVQRLAEGATLRGRVASAVLAFACGALLLARLDAWVAAGQLPPATRQALSRAALGTTPVDALCAPEGVRDWVPALVGRAAGEPGPWIPAVYADEWAARRPLLRPCQDLPR